MLGRKAKHKKLPVMRLKRTITESLTTNIENLTTGNLLADFLYYRSVNLKLIEIWTLERL